MYDSLTASQELIENRMKTERKVTGVYILILSIFLGTLIPGLMLLDLYVFVYYKQCMLGFLFNTIRYFLVTVNSVANPWVCTMRLKDFKNSIRAMFHMEYQQI